MLSVMMPDGGLHPEGARRAIDHVDMLAEPVSRPLGQTTRCAFHTEA
jgi:hypothetical protein